VRRNWYWRTTIARAKKLAWRNRAPDSRDQVRGRKANALPFITESCWPKLLHLSTQIETNPPLGEGSLCGWFPHDIWEPPKKETCLRGGGWVLRSKSQGETYKQFIEFVFCLFMITITKAYPSSTSRTFTNGPHSRWGVLQMSRPIRTALLQLNDDHNTRSLTDWVEKTWLQLSCPNVPQ